MRKYSILLIFLFSTSICIAQQSIFQLKHELDLALVGKVIYFWEDKTAHKNIQEILKIETEGKFKPLPTLIFTHAPSPSAYWLKIRVQNLTQKSAWIELGSAVIWYLDSYTFQEGKIVQTIKTGALRHENTKPYPTNLYWLPLLKTPQTQDIYIRIQTQMPTEIPIHIGGDTAMHTRKVYQDFLVGAFMGLMFGMFFYNLFLLFFLQDKVYAFYTLFILTTFFTVSYVNNYPFLAYLLPNEYKIYVHIYFLVWTKSSILIGVLFTIYFLELAKKMKQAIYVLYGFMIMLGVILPILNLTELLPFYRIAIFDLMVVMGETVYLFGMGVYLFWIKKDKYARYYVFAWVGLLICLFLYALVINGLLPYNYLLRNSLFLGVALQVTMFSMALGDRLYLMQKEKEKMQEENLKIITEQNITLEKGVKERTAEIEHQKEEILTQTEELKNANKRLVELDQFKQNMVSMIAHDLKNPLNALLHLQPERTQEYKNQVLHYTRQMQLLVFNMLDVQKFEEAQMNFDKKIVSLNQILQNAIQQITFLLIQKNININIQTDTSYEILADKELISRVIINLLTNAIKYSPFNAAIDIAIAEKDNQVHFTIKDYGMGIPANYLESIFEKFVQIEVQSSGGMRSTGLGLTFCKMAIEAHEGQIGVWSEYTQGATFWFSLPIVSVGKDNIIPILPAQEVQKQLTSQEKSILQPYLPDLKALEVYYASEINAILHKIPMHTEAGLQTWEKRLRASIIAMNQEKYIEILEEAR